ncbi:MAG: glycosyltransferase family 4 protein [Acidobacteria bacterium]|nr:glycosyltransferase family 4 protein [Acidobacteriota bacterium]
MKILVVGDTLGRVTGLGYVALSFAARLRADGHAVEYAVVTHERTRSTDYAHFPGALGECARAMKIHHLHDGGFPRDVLDAAMGAFKPEKVLVVHDPWNLDIVCGCRSRASFELTAYITIETPDYPARMKVARAGRAVYVDLPAVLKACDRVIPVTGPGRTVIEGFGVRTEAPLFNGLDAVEPVAMTKAEAFPGAKAEDFVFLAMGVNIHRKQLARTMEAFAAFLKQRPDAARFKLAMHTDLAIGNSADLMVLRETLGLQSQVLFTAHRLLSREELYGLYGAADAYLGLTGGEGFGYGFAEAMLNGLPILYTDYGCHTAMCEGIGLPVAISDHSYIPNSAIRIGLCDFASAVPRMNEVADDAGLRADMAEKGRRFAETHLMWETVYPQLRRLLLEA